MWRVRGRLSETAHRSRWLTATAAKLVYRDGRPPVGTLHHTKLVSAGHHINLWSEWCIGGGSNVQTWDCEIHKRNSGHAANGSYRYPTRRLGESKEGKHTRANNCYQQPHDQFSQHRGRGLDHRHTNSMRWLASSQNNGQLHFLRAT